MRPALSLSATATRSQRASGALGIFRCISSSRLLAEPNPLLAAGSEVEVLHCGAEYALE